MRLITRNRQSLHVWSVGDYIKQAQSNIIKQDSHRVLALQNIFQKLYIRQQENLSQDRRLSKRLNNIALAGATPARAIAEYFNSHQKKFSPEALVTTLNHISRACRISRDDNGGSLDSFGYQLYLSSEFSNLSEELKFALKNNKLNFRQVVSTMEACIEMEYIDHEIFQLFLNYTERQIVGGDYFEPLPGREFQVEKKNYYNSDELALVESIRGSNEIQMALGFVKHIHQEWIQHQTEVKNVEISELQNLVDSLAQTSRNFRSIVEGVLSVRRQYAKMVQLSKSELVLRDPNINLDLLLLQEKLLGLHLLNIHDIKNPQEIHSTNYEIKRVEQILRSYLEVDSLDPVFALLDKGGLEVEPYIPSGQPDVKKISTLLVHLAKIASFDRFVYHSLEGRSMVNLKWEKTLTEQITGTYIPSYPLKQQLNVARIFRRTYHEAMNLFNKHSETLQKIFRFADPESRVVLMEAYCRMGLHVQAIVEESSLENNSLPFQVSDLGKQSFCSLLHLFNDVGLFINAPELHSAIFSRLQKDLYLEENNRLRNTLEQTIDALNYLLQNHRNNSEYDLVYQGYIQILENKATYPAQQDGQELVIEAIKILALEKPQKFGSHPAYLKYVSDAAKDTLKRNPFHAILRETCYQWCDKENLLRKPQPYLPLGVSGGVPSVLIFGNSEDTSFDGQIRTGNFNSYILRLEAKGSMNVHEFSINSFLEFQTKGEQLFRLKPKETLQERFEQIFQKKEDQIDQIFVQHEKAINQILEAYPDCLISRKLRLKLAIIHQLRNNSFSLEIVEQEQTNTVLYFLEILELYKFLLLLREDQILSKIPSKTVKAATLNTRLHEKKAVDFQDQLIDVQVERIADLLKQTKSNFQDTIQSIADIIKEQTPSINPTADLLQGQRQTLEELNEGSPRSPGQIASTFVNQAYFNDKTFCQYEDWKERIATTFNMAQFDLAKASNITRILANKFCKGLTNKITYLPQIKHSQRVKRLDLNFRLISAKNQTSEHSVSPTRSQQFKELTYIINLQSFKHELKTTLSQEELLEHIFNFKFVLNLSSNQGSKQGLSLKRDAQKYFDYLEKIHEQAYLDSPYARYVLQHLSKTDRIRVLLDERKNLRIKQRRLYQQGSISAEDFYKNIDDLQNQIVAAAQQLKGKMLDHMEDQMIEGQFKMIDLRKEDLQAFEGLILKNFNYSRQFDIDFIHANGDYETALDLKRGRAQRNYIKMYLLYRLAEGKELNTKQTELVREWIQEAVRDTTEFTVYPHFSSMLISDLGWEDIQSLKMKSSSLNSNRDMLVVDLLMELNLFLDDSLIEGFERQVKAKYLTDKYNLPSHIFQKFGLRGLDYLENRVEEAIIDEASRLTEKELDTLEQIFKTFKVEGFKQRHRYQRLCGQFRQKVEHMNTQSIRNELIEEYVRLLEDEFVNEYDPALIAEIKEKQVDILWREIFHDPSQHCNKDHLKQIANKIIIRMELMKENSPPFFGRLLLNLLLHPKLDPLTKQTLIAALEYNRLELNIDSSDLEQIAMMKGRDAGQPTIAKETLRQASRARLGEYLYSRASSIV